MRIRLSHCCVLGGLFSFYNIIRIGHYSISGKISQEPFKIYRFCAKMGLAMTKLFFIDPQVFAGEDLLQVFVGIEFFRNFICEWFFHIDNQIALRCWSG